MASEIFEFTPALRGGVPVESDARFPVNFNLPAPVLASAASQYEQGSAAHNRGDYATAYRLWRPLAEQGLAEAQSGLGAMYANGHGVTQDYAAAVAWYRYAADNGHAGAKYFLKALCVQHATTTGCPSARPGLRPR